MDKVELIAICKALNVLIWKVPSVAGDESGQWWAAELQDKNIPIEWDNSKAEFIPKIEANGQKRA